MFYIKDTGGIRPYQAGAIAPRRLVSAVTATQATKPRGESGDVVSRRDIAHGVVQAYQRVVTPELPRRKVLFARELMSRDVKSIQPDAPISQAAGIFTEFRYRHLPVVDPTGGVIGILSDRDYLRFAAKGGDAKQLVSSLMSQPVLGADESTEIREVAKVMVEERVGCMPIVSSSGNLIGIITRSDILRTLVGQAPLELWL